MADLSGAVEVDEKTQSIQTSRPDLSGATEVPETKEQEPGLIAKGVRFFMKQTPFDAMEKSDWIDKHKSEYPKDDSGTPWSRYEKFIEPYEKMKVNEPLMQQLQGPLTVTAIPFAVSNPLLAAGGLAAATAWGHFFDARKYMAQHFPEMSRTWQDLAEIAQWGTFGAVTGVGMQVSKGLKAFPSPYIHDLQSEKLTDIQQNLNLNPQEQGQVFKTLGIKPEHIDSAKSQNMSLKIPMDKIAKLSRNTKLWDKVKDVFNKETTDGSPAKINNAALMIKGQLREGPSHPQILEDAVKDGTMTQKEAKAFDIEGEGMFVTNLKGRGPITRQQAMREFGIDHSEQIPEQGYKFVKNDPFKVRFGKDMKKTGRFIREDWSGLKNFQIVRGTQLMDHIKRLVPDDIERKGLFWYKAAKGNTNIIKEAIEDERFSPYKKELNAALNLSSKQTEALDMINQYYEESGRVSKSLGTINNIVENYQNRMTVKMPSKEQPLKTESGRSVLSDFTKHRLQRVFKSEFEAVLAGYGFKTTDVAESLSIHNEEMAGANATKKLFNALQQAKIGSRVLTNKVPFDYDIVKGSEKEIPIKNDEGKAVIGKDGNQVVVKTGFAAPVEMVKALKAITEPNYVKWIDSLRGIQKYQGLVKTVDLAYSFFHHFSMAAQTCYQGGIPALMNAGRMNEIFASRPFNEIEKDFVTHTGMTSKVEQNRDILRNILELDKGEIKKNPVLDAAFKVAHRNTEFLFTKFQRFLKVSDYGSKLSKWIGDHPAATNAEIRSAKIEIAKQINTVYGGLNWAAMGITRSNLSLLRLGLLAPDWTISNIQLLKQAIGEKGLAGNLSRVHILTALAGGMMLTEGLNQLTTGHFTDENQRGHALEWQISPDVYVSFLRGGIGDISKAASMFLESGWPGISRFAQGKLAPLPRVFTGVTTNIQYSGGREIVGPKEGYMYGTAHELAYILANGGPMPFSASNFGNYLKDEPDKTFFGGAAVLTGLGRYSRPPSSKRKPVQRRSFGQESEMVSDKAQELFNKMQGKENE